MAGPEPALLPPPRGGGERGVGEAGVGGVDGEAGGDDLIDAVEEGFVELHVGGAELRVELLERARSDDRGGDRGVADDEGEREMDQRDAGLIGELRERVGGLELGLIGGDREVIALLGSSRSAVR